MGKKDLPLDEFEGVALALLFMVLVLEWWWAKIYYRSTYEILHVSGEASSFPWNQFDELKYVLQ